MQLFKIAATITIVVLAAACGPSGTGSSGHDHDHEFADLETDLYWELNSDASRLSFTSIKAGEVIEVHSFSGLYGVVTPEGTASVAIPLDEVETQIDIRNQRMREILFETEIYPTAKIDVSISPKTLSDLALGGRQETEIEGSLSLHGVDATIGATVLITRIGPDRIEVASAEPVILHVEDFNLSAGLEALREIANLPAITPAAPVTFSFVFEAQHL